MLSYAPIHPERPVRRAAVAVAISLAMNALILLLAASLVRAATEAARVRAAEQPKEVALAELDAARWEANRRVAGTFVPSAAFDTAPGDFAKPEHARFLSDRDRRVDRETVAAPAPGMPGRPKGGAAERPAQGSSGASSSSASRADTAPPVPGAGAGSQPPEKGPDLTARPLANRLLAMDFDKGGEGGVPEIDGVAVGGLTVLNAEAWRYATFFDRVGDTLYGVWRVEFMPRPMPPSIAARRGGGIARVALSVTLDASGRAVVVAVRRSSGMQDVDSLLSELVLNSAPFPNVPPGLLDDRREYTDTWILALLWGRGP